jgi:hypothetical protein
LENLPSHISKLYRSTFSEGSVVISRFSVHRPSFHIVIFLKIFRAKICKIKLQKEPIPLGLLYAKEFKSYDLNLTLLSEAQLHFDAMLMFQGRSHKDEKGEQTG